MEVFQLTSHTDGEVVSKHLSDVPNKIGTVGETIRDWFPLLTVRGIWTFKAKSKQNKRLPRQFQFHKLPQSESSPRPFPSISMHNTTQERAGVDR
jgi:hypothetical protein